MCTNFCSSGARLDFDRAGATAGLDGVLWGARGLPNGHLKVCPILGALLGGPGAPLSTLRELLQGWNSTMRELLQGWIFHAAYQNGALI